MAKDHTAAFGFFGFITSLSLGELNHLVGIGVGLLTAAYLVRKHVRMSKEKKDE